MRYEYVLFDLDGTLLETSSGIIKSARHTVEKMGLPKTSDEVLRGFIGPPLEQSFKKQFNLSDKDVAAATEIFREVYKEKNLFDAKLYDGVFDMLKTLRENRAKIALATYKRHDLAGLVIEKFKINEYCENYYGSDSDKFSVKSAIITECLNGINADRSRSLYVGDTIGDAKSAFEAGIDFVGVSYGFGFNAETETIEYPCAGIFKNVSDLTKFLLR